MARGLKFRIQVEEELYYPCSENNGADQLRGYREADLRLCFRICKYPVFSRRGSNRHNHDRSLTEIIKSWLYDLVLLPIAKPVMLNHAVLTSPYHAYMQ